MSVDKNKVAYCPHCGAMTLACDFELSETDEDCKKDFADLVKKNYKLDIVSAETVRKEFGSDHSDSCPLAPPAKSRIKPKELPGIIVDTSLKLFE